MVYNCHLLRTKVVPFQLLKTVKSWKLRRWSHWQIQPTNAIDNWHSQLTQQPSRCAIMQHDELKTDPTTKHTGDICWLYSIRMNSKHSLNLECCWDFKDYAWRVRPFSGNTSALWALKLFSTSGKTCRSDFCLFVHDDWEVAFTVPNQLLLHHSGLTQCRSDQMLKAFGYLGSWNICLKNAGERSSSATSKLTALVPRWQRGIFGKASRCEVSKRMARNRGKLNEGHGSYRGRTWVGHGSDMGWTWVGHGCHGDSPFLLRLNW